MILAFILLIVTLFAGDVDEDVGFSVSGNASGALLEGAVPEEFVQWIEKAVADCGNEALTAPVLAAQLWQESRFDPDAVGPEVTIPGTDRTDRAEGIAQFMPGTWAGRGVDANNNGTTSPFEPPDAIVAQGNFMCDLLDSAENSGYPGDPIVLALAGYNAGWGAVQDAGGVPEYEETQNYVTAIMEKAEEFTDPSGDGTLLVGVEGDIAGAVQWAVAQEGTWYVWGGHCKNPQKSMQGTPHNWTATDVQNNCDCSSLMQQAYDKIGVSLPRVTYDQVNVGQAVSPNAVEPGDLLFPSSGHVGMYIGNNQVVHAPETGRKVEITDYSPGYWGAYAVRRVINTDQ
ncbi:NlpC/P60 family protein [Nocardiopsis aegyptia]|uniref:C40 family peptidase n=1 Tax=Nocardiopsis aegyptia TaxID=220378 RepID=UPI00366D9AE1